MSKLVLTQPTLIALYGYPGSGKTFLARQMCGDFQAAHIQSERVRFELFTEPRYDRQENQVVTQIMNYMAQEFLDAGVSVVYDTNAVRLGQRRDLRQLANSRKAANLLIWLQIDAESAFARVQRRDRRRSDDKYTQTLDRDGFEAILRSMQNPVGNEDYMVISGKHTYQTQRANIMKKLYDVGLITMHSSSTTGTVMPGMVNLIPNRNPGRVDTSRRNINIH